MLSRDELAGWLRLSNTPGLSRGTARRLLKAFGAPDAVLGATDDALCALAGADTVLALRGDGLQQAAQLEATQRWLDGAAADGTARDIVVLGDARFPPLLLQTADPPLLLYAMGRVELLSAPSVAIVGSRDATPQGLDNARDFARALSEQGLTIVSGMAKGIDGAAHDGALAGRGSTVAFVGTGLDRVYPPRHVTLMRRIAQHGLVASEYALGTPARPEHFPRRNRLIAGLARGTLVVEAALESGSLITARLAVECGRDVFAIPGSIHSPQARGCHRLIQEGAKLVETAEDVLRELLPGDAPVRARLSPPRPSLFAEAASLDDDDTPPAARDPDAALRSALGHDPVSFDALSARTGLPADQLAARLLELELTGAVQRLPGGLLQRRGRG
ncbi:MAG: DNA-processing protein DprA [Vitreoscilla sp.]